jgi:ribosomal-protein-alanine N-acetyltransferase
MTLLETQRLRLREITSNDFEDLYRMNSDPEVMKYVGDGSVRTREQMVHEMEVLISHYMRKPGPGIWAVERKKNSLFVGAAGLVSYDNTREIEVGYRLMKEHWNKGYATEAASALIKYGFEKLRLKKLVSSAHIHNRASTRVMEKIGMRYVDDRFQYGCMQSYYEILNSAF